MTTSFKTTEVLWNLENYYNFILKYFNSTRLKISSVLKMKQNTKL